MKRNNRVYGILLAVILFIPLISQVAADEWRGRYFYPDNRSSVEFTLQLNGSQGQVTGRTSEPNTFGKPPAPSLFGNVAGRINGSDVSFTKTYDGTGGVNHSVEYRGTISGNTMSGNWTIGNTSGRFTATRTAAQPIADVCDRCERFRGQADRCNSCCHCQQTNKTSACYNQYQGDPLNSCLNQAATSRQNCNIACR